MVNADKTPKFLARMEGLYRNSCCSGGGSSITVVLVVVVSL